MALLKILKLKKPEFFEDCKELLKHLPSRTLIDEVRLEYFDFIVRLYDQTVPIDDAIPSDLEPHGSLRKAIVRRVYIELQEVRYLFVPGFFIGSEHNNSCIYNVFQMEANENCDIYTSEEKKRIISIYKQLAAESNDPRDIVLGKLKEILVATPLDVIYNSDFPYACLTSLFEGNFSDIHDRIIILLLVIAVSNN